MQKIGGILAALILLSSTCYGWDKHQALMPLIFNSSSPLLKHTFAPSESLPCESHHQEYYSTLIQQLDLNPKSVLPHLNLSKCEKGTKLTVYDILTSNAIDDPDQGMDRDLPDTPDHRYDPTDSRKWMGGKTGPTSQGFRHMYFGGWQITHPLATFQIPYYAVGQAPFRAQILAEKAKALLKSGKGNEIWGYRLLIWAMHYIQDLTQPFHTVQIVNLKLVPWDELLKWPPSEGFRGLVRETTRIITNYHWAYEGYTLDRVLQNEKSPYYYCLSHPESYTSLRFNPKTQTPLDLALEITSHSIELASQVGEGELEFFGPHLKERGIDFTQNPNMIHYTEYSTRPDLSSARDKLQRVTCTALAHASLASRLLLEWALQP